MAVQPLLQSPVGLTLHAARGSLHEATGRYAKTLGQLSGLYADERALSELLKTRADEVVYEVSEFRASENAGDLVFGATRMAPGKVGSEYFMTRGHSHRNADRAEIYFGQRGTGLMLMESPAGEIRSVVIEPQTICYVPPFWIHRSMNIGSDELVMMFCYPSDAGQDYEIITSAGGMRVRVVDDGASGWRTVDNLGYRPRRADQGVPTFQ